MKVTVFFERTVQIEAFEPFKFGVSLEDECAPEVLKDKTAALFNDVQRQALSAFGMADRARELKITPADVRTRPSAPRPPSRT